jgi:hypothetical protein
MHTVSIMMHSQLSYLKAPINTVANVIIITQESLPGDRYKAGSLKMNTTLEYSTRVVQEGGRRCKMSTLKGTVSRDFLLQDFFMNHLLPSP